MKKIYDKHEALKYLSQPSRIILREIPSGLPEGMKLLLLGSSRPERARNVHIAIQCFDGSMTVYQPDAMRAVVGNTMNWTPLQKASELLRAEIAHFFYIQLARSRESMVLFRFDVPRLLQARMYLRHLANFNRLVIEANGGTMHDLGSRELETGLPDKMLWVEDCHGKLAGEVYHIRRTITHHHFPESDFHDMESINRHCFVDASIQLKQNGSLMRIKKTYALSVWPTANQLMSDHADAVRSELAK